MLARCVLPRRDGDGGRGRRRRSLAVARASLSAVALEVSRAQAIQLRARAGSERAVSVALCRRARRRLTAPMLTLDTPRRTAAGATGGSASWSRSLSQPFRSRGRLGAGSPILAGLRRAGAARSGMGSGHYMPAAPGAAQPRNSLAGVTVTTRKYA